MIMSPFSSVEANVYIVHPDPFACQPIARLSQEAGLVTSSHTSAQDFLNSLDPQPIGCVITYLWLPDLGGLELLDHLRHKEPTLATILLADPADVATVVKAFHRGVRDVFFDDFSDYEMLAGIRDSVRESREACRRLYERQRVLDSLNLLTSREHQVLQGLLQGQPNKQIAGRLNLSQKTVASHRANLISKMGADSLVGLVQTLMAHLTDSELSELT